jgi:hypothetical protein
VFGTCTIIIPSPSLTNVVQNAPTDCDMALVHDDDLIYIDVDVCCSSVGCGLHLTLSFTQLDNLQPDAVLGNLRNSRPGIWWAQCGMYSAINFRDLPW